MSDLILGMAMDLAMLKSAFGNSIKVGPVAIVDAQKGYRMRLGGSDAEPFLSPWYPHPETGKTSVPLEVGQIVGMINPSGDPRKGILIRGGYSDQHASPNSDMEANVFRAAGVTLTIKGGSLVAEAGGVKVTISGDGLNVEGGGVHNNGKNIGATHTHGGIFPGGSDTDVPNG